MFTVCPPMAAAMSTWYWPGLFTKQERVSSWPSMLFGKSVSTEPAIPTALAAPDSKLLAKLLSGGMSGAVSMGLGV